MVEKSVRVVLDEQHLTETDKVSRALEAVGMKIKEVIPEAGLIYGVSDEQKLDKIRKTEGVLEAAEEDTYQLPPMSDDVPQ